MSSLSSQLVEVGEKFKTLDKKIRLLLVIGMLFLIYAAVDKFLIQSIFKEYQSIVVDIARTTSSRKNIENEIKVISNQLRIEPQFNNSTQVDLLKAKIEKLDQSLKNASTQLVTSDEMIKFLNDLITAGDKIELLKMEKLPIEFSILKTMENEVNTEADLTSNAEISQSKLYRHGIIISLQGSYAEIVKYMQSVENLPWRIFWGASSLNTESYPLAIISFEVYTLSFDENWLTL